MRSRGWIMAPLLLIVSLTGCGAQAEDETIPEESISPPSSAATSTPTHTWASAAPSPTTPAATTSTAPVLAWSNASLWATCEREWERKNTGITWTGWEAFRSADASTTADGLHYVARYEKDSNGAVIADRDCIIGGTRSVPSVFLDPPLDGFDRSKMPSPSTTFAVP